jgi:hypothetical protein
MRAAVINPRTQVHAFFSQYGLISAKPAEPGYLMITGSVNMPRGTNFQYANSIVCRRSTTGQVAAYTIPGTQRNMPPAVNTVSFSCRCEMVPHGFCS